MKIKQSSKDKNKKEIDLMKENVSFIIQLLINQSYRKLNHWIKNRYAKLQDLR